MALTEMLKNPDTRSSRFIAFSLIKELAAKNATIAIAEGCSGGSLLNALTIPGSTQVFHVGHVAYSRKAKIDLGVPEYIIDNYGEYSLKVAVEMAKSVRRLRNDTLAVATVGNIDTDDNHPFPVIHLGFARKDYSCWGQTIILRDNPRKVKKTHLANIALSKSLMFFKGQEQREIEYRTIELLQPLASPISPLEKQASEIVKMLINKNLRIATMESCTGGAVADEITNIPGASKVLDSCWVAYDENVKASLGVPLLAMANGGVYSERVAIEMAKAVYRKTGAEITIGITGAMDTLDRRPFHTDTQPGTVYIAIYTKGNQLLSRKLHTTPNTREEMKKEVVAEVFKALTEIISRDDIEPIFPFKQENHFLR